MGTVMRMKWKEHAKQLRTSIPAVSLCLRDPAVPAAAKFFAGAAVAYALSPIDLIPDFIPILGYLDDLLVLPALVALAIHFTPKPVWEKNVQRAQRLEQGAPAKKWRYALPILLAWILILGLIVKAVLF